MSMCIIKKMSIMIHHKTMGISYLTSLYVKYALYY